MFGANGVNIGSRVWALRRKRKRQGLSVGAFHGLVVDRATDTDCSVRNMPRPPCSAAVSYKHI